MKVNDRKLFANRDARRTLSQMGGIVASSPELLGTAQKFQVGGMTMSLNRSNMIPTTPSAVGGSIAAEALMQDPRIRTAAMQSGMTPAEYISRLSPEQFSRAIAMLSEDMAGTVRDEASFEAAEFDANRYDGPGGSFAVTEPELTSAPTLSQEGLTGIASVPTVGSEDIRRMANANPVTPSDAERLAIAGDIVAAPIAAGVESLAQNGVPLGNAYVSAMESLAGIPLYTPGERESLSPENYVNPVDEFPEGADQAPARLEAPEPDTAGPDDGTRDPVEETTDDPDAPTLEDLQVAVETSDDPSAAGARTILEGAGAGEGFDLGSVEGRISAYEELFGRMLGESDEEKRREKYMNLAMIGFAIAAGEDPSALKNIADGLLAGTAQMQESAAASREREDRIKELAISMGFEDYQAAVKAAADAAGEDPESFFGTDAGEFASDTYSDLITAGLTHTQAIERMNEAGGMGDRLLEAVELELAPQMPSLTPEQRVSVQQAREALADGADRAAVEDVLRGLNIDPRYLGQ